MDVQKLSEVTLKTVPRIETLSLHHWDTHPQSSLEDDEENEAVDTCLRDLGDHVDVIISDGMENDPLLHTF